MPHRFISSINQVSAMQWDNLCPASYPFIRHRFLAALELSGSCSAKNGWQPHHLLMEEDGKLVAALPGYIKSHSYGEYVFDWAWADAYHRYGHEYYPKLISAIPFTPCYGARLLVAPGQSAEQLYLRMFACIQQEVERLGLSGWHCLFPADSESRRWEDAGTVMRLGCQFHWFNRDYQGFENFLAQLSSRKRKTLRKERQQVAAQGLRFEWLTGSQLTPEICAHFYQLYRNTYRKRSGHDGYLSADFFARLGPDLADMTLLIRVLNSDGDAIAAALFFYDECTLYGRYWGCLEEYQFLHFETCYYQGIEFAIAHGLQRFDGGAQGEHKLARGFEPLLTYSNHWLCDADFTAAVSRFVAGEAQQVRAYREEAIGYLPYREGVGLSRDAT